jgi:hypothetical protein
MTRRRGYTVFKMASCAMSRLITVVIAIIVFVLLAVVIATAAPAVMPTTAPGIAETVTASPATVPPATRLMSLAPQKKYTRRTKAAIAAIEAAIFDSLKADHPQTVRQLFYQLVSAGVVQKTEEAYKGLVGRLCVRLRRAGVLPYDWIADNTRWMRKPTTYTGLEAALRRTAETYRRSLFAKAESYVEIWLEKDALAGVLYDVTAEWDVPLMVTRGYPSLSYLFEAAETIKAQRRPVSLYYFGDHDPSGVDIPRKVESELRRMAPRAEIQFERVAVTPRQIRTLRLPTRPTKTTDSRAKRFVGESVEVDAIPARLLRRIAEQCILRHVDRHQRDMLLVAEESERKILMRLAKKVSA